MPPTEHSPLEQPLTPSLPSDSLEKCVLPVPTILGSVDLEILFSRGEMLPWGPHEVSLTFKATIATGPP